MRSGIAKLLAATGFVFGLVGSIASPCDSIAYAETPVSSERVGVDYAATKESRDFRVTLLGVTKGVSFLQTPEPVSDDGRVSGNHPVRWMRIAALVEELGEKEAAPSLQVEAADGVELVGKIPVDQNDNVVTMRSSGTKEMDLDFGQLAPTIFPVALPKAQTDREAKVFVFTLSGDVRPSDSATLRFQFGTADDRQEIVFPGVPVP